MNIQYRSQVLTAFGASAAETEELLTYNQNVFNHDGLSAAVNLPPPDEAFVAAWAGYLADSVNHGVFATLQQRLIQLRFPIQEGISQSDPYKAATLKWGPMENMSAVTGVLLAQPDQLELVLQPTLGGHIPMIILRNRADFVTIVQALAHKNEPVAIPDSMGASLVTGYNNWDRILAYKKRWAEANGDAVSEDAWQEEFRRLIPQTELYRDRFIILSDGPYSSVPARELGLAEHEWRKLSLIIRREHECTHYFTWRLLGAMRNNMLDELIADYMGIVAAIGRYDARWFLRFTGLENFPDFRESGRLSNYRGKPALSDGAFRVLRALVKNAAENLERFDREQRLLTAVFPKNTILLALTRLTLEELAAADALQCLRRLMA